MANIEVENLSKRFGNVQAVDDVSFTVEDGTMTCIVGPSGCGKTTTLRCVAGLERPDSGRVKIGDQIVTDPSENIFIPPHQRDIGFVFQTFDVWPHLTVAENVSYPLRMRGGEYDENLVYETLKLAGIEDLADSPTTQLSGGQQARVGICRAIVDRPRILLFDEPLTGLDRNLRKKMRYEIKRIQSEVDITSLYVTHSQPEAMTLGDKVVLLNSGKLVPESTSREIYNSPKTRFAFDFFGTAEEIAGTVVNEDTVETDLGDFHVGDLRHEVGREVTLGFRPNNVEVSTDSQGENSRRGTIRDISFLGEMTEVLVEVNGTQLRSRHVEFPESIEEGADVYIHIDPNSIHAF